MTNDPSDSTQPSDVSTASDGSEPLGDAGRKALDSERRGRREAEAKLTTLGRRVESLQRAEAQRLAGLAADGFRPLTDPTDLWRAENVDLGGLLTDDGNVDPAKVRAAVDGIVTARPHWAAQPSRRPDGTADGGRGAPSAPSMDKLAETLMRGR